MKKVMLFAITILIILSMFGCNATPKAEFKEEEMSVYIGEEIYIPVRPLTEKKFEVVIISTDEQKLTKTGGNTFEAVSDGIVVLELWQRNKVIDTCSIIIKIPVEKATFDYEEISVSVGDEFELGYTFTPTDASNQQFEYKIDKKEFLDLQENGNFLAMAEGTATVTLCQEGREFDTCKVHIYNVPAEAIEFEEKNIEIYIGRETDIPVIFTPSNATFKDLEVSVSNGKCLEVGTPEVAGEIRLTGKTAGTVTLTAITQEGLKATMKVKIVPVVLGKLQAYALYDKESVLVGQTGKVGYDFFPKDVTEKAVSFRSSNTRVLTIDKEGNYKAVGVGTATVTVTHNKSRISDTIEITVKPVEVTSVSINQSNLALYPNETNQLNATVRPSDATYPKVTWSSSNTEVATVSNNGLVRAKKAGSATITAKTENGKYDSVRVTVKPTTKSFTVTITATCDYYNHVGNEWGEYFWVNNQPVRSGSKVSITMGRSTSIHTQIIEFDSINDVGRSTYSFVVPKEYFESGFYATQRVQVRENGGRYRGHVAIWDIKYSFRPA